MKLVVLDSYVAVSTDLSLDCLKEFCDEMYTYDRTPPEEVINRIGDAEMVLVNKTVLTGEILAQCPSVKYIGLFATGYNVIDVDYCRAHGIVVANAPAYSTDAVAQLVFAFLLSFADLTAKHDAEVHDGVWQNCKDFAFYDPRIFELAGKTIGLVGFGNIGRRVAELAIAFHMEVLVFSRTVRKEMETEHLRFVPLPDLLHRSDFISLHCPLFPETTRLINADTISQMKNGAYLINTARGGIIDEQAVADALNSGKLAGAAVDVATKEPINGDNPLLTAANCIITPHIAWATKETRRRLIGIVRDNICAFTQGHPMNNVAEAAHEWNTPDSGITIHQISADELGDCLHIIHTSFASVAEEFGLTEENCPTHTSFISADKLQSEYDNGWPMYVLELNGKKVGYFSLCRKDESRYELCNLAVMPGVRHKGFGQILVKYAVEEVCRLGGTTLCLSIIAESVKLREWYLHLGFHSLGSKNFDHMPFTVEFMERSITE